MVRSVNNTELVGIKSPVLHWAVWPVSQDRVHLRNLQDSRVSEFPNNLDMPVWALPDDPGLRWIAPTALTFATFYGRIRNADPHRGPAELFGWMSLCVCIAGKDISLGEGLSTPLTCKAYTAPGSS